MDYDNYDLVGLDTVYILLHYDPNQVGLLNSGNDGVNDALRQYGVGKIIDMIYVVLVCLIMAVRIVSNVSKQILLGMVYCVVIV